MTVTPIAPAAADPLAPSPVSGTATLPPDVVAPPKTERLLSLDALRGFDMFWILGGEEIIHNLYKAFPNRVTETLSYEFDHAAWQGLRAYDLIFPTFVFIVGVSMVFSLGKLLRTQGRAAAVKRVVVRGVVLYLLGLVYYGGFNGAFSHIRPMGVLQRIALAYLFGGLLFCFLRPKPLALVTAALLVGYWAFLSFVPIPGADHVSFRERENWPNWFDAHYMPGRQWDGDHDPEGLLSTFPAVANCLLGVFAGLLLKDPRVAPTRKVGALLCAGAAGVIAGYVWGLQFPIVKKLWTSSFVLVACGYATLLLALFYLVIDVQGWRRWCTPFVWIGMNAITLYLLFQFVEFPAIAARLVGAPGSDLYGYYHGTGDLVLSFAVVGLVLLLARFLYKRQIFLRV
jgi:predicted acyltransferase